MFRRLETSLTLHIHDALLGMPLPKCGELASSLKLLALDRPLCSVRRSCISLVVYGPGPHRVAVGIRVELVLQNNLLGGLHTHSSISLVLSVRFILQRFATTTSSRTGG